MKPFNFRAAFPIKRPVQKPRSIYSPRRHAKHQPHHGNTRKRRVPDRTPRHRAPHRPQHRRNRGGVLTYNRQQKQRQHRRSRQNRRRNVLPQLCRHREMCRARIHNSRASARKIFVPVQKHAHHNAHRPQHRRNRDDVLSFSRQQRRRQRRRSRQKCRRNVLPQLRQHRKPRHDRQRKRPVSAQMIYDCALNRNRRSIRQPQHHKNLDGVLLFKRR